MNILLSCTECGYAVESRADKHLINKIIMWNHAKKAHPAMAAAAQQSIHSYSLVRSTLYNPHQEVRSL